MGLSEVAVEIAQPATHVNMVLDVYLSQKGEDYNLFAPKEIKQGTGESLVTIHTEPWYQRVHFRCGPTPLSL